MTRLRNPCDACSQRYETHHPSPPSWPHRPWPTPTGSKPWRLSSRRAQRPGRLHPGGHRPGARGAGRAHQDLHRHVRVLAPQPLPLRLPQAVRADHRGRRPDPLAVRRRPQPGDGAQAGAGAGRHAGGHHRGRARPVQPEARLRAAGAARSRRPAVGAGDAQGQGRPAECRQGRLPRHRPRVAGDPRQLRPDVGDEVRPPAAEHLAAADTFQFKPPPGADVPCGGIHSKP
jgi:hypothetical protein